MTIQSVRLVPYALPLRDPWPTREGPITERHGFLLVLTDEAGRMGLGDTAPLPGFGLETLASSATALRSAARRLVGLPSSSYREAAASLSGLAAVAAAPAARHAIDLALHDLAAQEVGRPIAALLAEEAAASVSAHVAIPRVAPGRAAALARDAVASGARTLKIKVGGATLAEDLGRVRAIRDEVGRGIALRVDANEAWSESEAIEALSALAVYDLELAEQPVPAAAITALARVRRATGIAIAADEAIVDRRSAGRVLDAEAADVLIVKPMVLGGLYAAGAIATLARERGVGVIVTSFVESAVGRTGALHFAASLGSSPYAHGIATGGSLAADVADAPGLAGGQVAVPRGPGLGVTLDPERLHAAVTVGAA